MKNSFLKLLKTTNEMAFTADELQKDSGKSDDKIDYKNLGLDKKKYNFKVNAELNREKSMYALVKYTNEHPTPWMYDYYLESIDDDAFNWIIEKGYITKVMPDKFPDIFKDCTVEELKRESESSHDLNTTKEDMIEYFQDWCDYSWIVSEKGHEYLKSHPFLEFFTNNLIDFNIYEFKLFCDKFDELSLEEAGDKYVNAKLEHGVGAGLYLKYIDYYYNLNLSLNDIETACIYLIQRIIYELNIWHLKEFHVAFDEPLSIMTDYLIFKIIKQNPDFDLEKLYEEAYNSLKFDELKFNYSENYEIVQRLINGESIYDIGEDLLDQAKEDGLVKSFFG